MSGVLTQPSRVRNVTSFIVVGLSAPVIVIASASGKASLHISTRALLAGALPRLFRFRQIVWGRRCPQQRGHDVLRIGRDVRKCREGLMSGVVAAVLDE